MKEAEAKVILVIRKDFLMRLVSKQLMLAQLFIIWQSI
jgi:hypothetical protein